MEIPSGYASFGGGGAIEKVTGSVPREQLDRTGQSLIVVSRWWATATQAACAGDAPITEMDSATSSSTALVGGPTGGVSEHQQKELDKKKLCIDLLIGGWVASFVDLLKIYQEDWRRAQDGLSDLDCDGGEDGVNKTVSLEELRAEKSLLERRKD